MSNKFVKILKAANEEKVLKSTKKVRRDSQLIADFMSDHIKESDSVYAQLRKDLED